MKRNRAPRSASTLSATAAGQWDPKNQRPELWNLYNARIHPGESIRVFPLSNWTEMDVWQYIHEEKIPVVDLYFAKERPMYVRGDALLPIEQSFCGAARRAAADGQVAAAFAGMQPLHRGDSLGRRDDSRRSLRSCFTSASSERANRVIDHDQEGSMEIEEAGGILLNGDCYIARIFFGGRVSWPRSARRICCAFRPRAAWTTASRR